jgi:hypothetical protein
MRRSRLTWLIVGGVVSVLVAGAVDAFRGSPSRPEPVRNPYLAPSPAPAGAATPPGAVSDDSKLPRCKTQQLALDIENLGGSPALALVHAWAGPCRTPRLPIDIALLDRAGHSVEAEISVQRAFAPTTLSPNAELSAPFSYAYLCGEPKPVRVVAEAGPYPARGRLAQIFGACLDDFGP